MKTRQKEPLSQKKTLKTKLYEIPHPSLPFIMPFNINSTEITEDSFEFQPRTFLRIASGKMFIFNDFSFLEADNMIEKNKKTD